MRDIIKLHHNQIVGDLPTMLPNNKMSHGICNYRGGRQTCSRRLFSDIGLGRRRWAPVRRGRVGVVAWGGGRAGGPMSSDMWLRWRDGGGQGARLLRATVARWGAGQRWWVGGGRRPAVVGGRRQRNTGVWVKVGVGGRTRLGIRLTYDSPDPAIIS
jgi:hypothetical protein